MVGYEHIGQIKDLHKYESLDDAFAKVDDWMDDKNQNHLYNNVFRPAHDDLYQTTKDEVEALVDGDHSKSLYKKKSDLEKVLTKGLKKFFEKAHPNILTEDFDDWDAKDQYNHLVNNYVQIAGKAGQQRIQQLMSFSQQKKATVGDFIRQLGSDGDKLVGAMVQTMNNKYIDAQVGSYESHQLAEYFVPQFEEAGWDLDDKVAVQQFKADQWITLKDLLKQKNLEKQAIFKKKSE